MNCLQYYCAKTLEIAIKINVGRTILRILERERINKEWIWSKTSFSKNVCLYLSIFIFTSILNINSWCIFFPVPAVQISSYNRWRGLTAVCCLTDTALIHYWSWKWIVYYFAFGQSSNGFQPITLRIMY